MNSIGITILRIDADAVDSRGRANRQRVVNRLNGMTSALYDEMLAHLPSKRLRTRVTSNAAKWESAIAYLTAMGDDQRDLAFARSLPADGWLDHEKQWREAERRDAARETKLFTWHRPLVRLGALAAFHEQPSVAERQQVGEAFPGATWLTPCMLVIPGVEQMIAQRLQKALKTPDCTGQRIDNSQEGEKT